MKVLSIALATTALSAIEALPESHRVKSLPGWNKPLPSKVFAGHIDAGNDGKYQMYEHYMFVESENDPENDPVLVWTNGGPGASSLFGYFVELGSLQLSGESLKTEEYKKTGVPSLYYNPYGWTKFANVLVLNSPPPVGYSYCDPVGPTGDGYSCGDWNDERTSKHNRIFLENWLKAFPEYKDHDWLITGESYAGVYVPTLVRELLDNAETFPVDKLRGFAVGDGCVGTDINCAAQGPYYTLEFLHGHNQFSEKLYTEIQQTCDTAELYNGVKDPECQKLIDRMYKQSGGFYEYNLYDECWGDRDFEPAPQNLRRKLGGLNDYPCGGSRAMQIWLDTQEVRKALHVTKDAKFFSGDNGVGFTYKMTEKNLVPFYKRAVENTNLRVIVYNGDTDPGLNTIVAQNWTSSVGVPEKEEWRPWTLDGKTKIAGYVTRYENNFDFLTIRGSGHMVPEFKPAAAFEFMSRWVKNEAYQTYNPPKAMKQQPIVVNNRKIVIP